MLYKVQIRQMNILYKVQIRQMNKGSPDLNVIYDNSYIIIIMYIIRRARPKTIYIYIYM